MDTMPRSQLRISDADRDRAIAELSEHFQAGRITQDELEERTGQVLQARTGQDLAAVFADLPPRQAPQNRPAAGPADAGPAAQPPAPYRAPIPRIAIAACVILVVGSILGGSSSGHHGWFALAPIIIVLLAVRCLAGRHQAWDRRARDRRTWDHRPR